MHGLDYIKEPYLYDVHNWQLAGGGGGSQIAEEKRENQQNSLCHTDAGRGQNIKEIGSRHVRAFSKADGSTAFETLEKSIQTIFNVTGDKGFRNEALAALYVGKRWLKHQFKSNVGMVKLRCS